MRHKLIYFGQIPLQVATMQKYYMKELAAAGFEVEYLNLRPLFPYYVPPTVPIQYSDFERVIYSIEELRQYIKQQDVATALFISNITYYPPALRIFRQLNKQHCRTCCMAIGMLPTATLMANGRKAFFAKLKRLSFRKLYNYFQLRITPFLIKIGYLSNYDIIFYVGNILWKRNSALQLQNPEWAKSLVAINTPDYDLARSIQDKERIVQGEYMLFLDEYLPLHPDLFLLGRVRPMDASKYYRELNVFFDRIEHYYQMPVVIAAHPKAERYQSEDFFQGRTVIFGETALLARDAHLLVTHHSTAIGFAPIFRKPILFISSKDIRSSLGECHNDIISRARALGGSVVDYDDPEVDLDGVTLTICQSKYDSYKYSYLTSRESEDQSTLDILLRYLANL